MYKLSLKITLNSPVVLPASDKTEVTLNCLNYIPGSVLLGIVAGKLYNEETGAKTLDLFHNGKVSFGNAYLTTSDNKAMLPVPAVCYTEKGKNLIESIMLHHSNEAKDDGRVWKQVRSGYFTRTEQGIELADVKKDASLKTAYDSPHKSSKAEQLFLYEFIEKGQVFISEILSENREYLKEIEALICGKAGGTKIHNIAKSRTSEFGNVSIQSVGIQINEPKTIVQANQMIVYAVSNLAFINEYAEYTLRPQANDLGFTNAEIDYEKSQLWFDKLHVRNGKRKTNDAERLIIKKGSVFVLKLKTDATKFEFDADKIHKGLGVHKAEGYGRVLINPEFLQKFQAGRISKIDKPDEMITSTSPLNSLLEAYKKKEDNQRAVYIEVAKGIGKHLFDGVSASQWGALRGLIYQARQTENPESELYRLLFKGTGKHDKDQGFFNHPKRKMEWDNILPNLKKLIDYKQEIAQISENSIEKLLLLCIEQAKNNKQ